MKINISDINSFFKTIPSNIHAALIYGPDNGLVFERAASIQNYFRAKYQEIVISRYSYDALKTGKIDLASSSQNLSFFSNFQIYILDDVPQKIDKPVEIFLENLTEKNFVIFIAKELAPSSSFRKYFETKNYTASIACYKDDARAIRMLAIGIFNENKKKYSEDVLAFIEHHISGDRKNIINEISKVVTYIGEKDHISLEDVKLCCSLPIDISYDYLCHAIGGLDSKLALELVDSLVEKGTPIISLMRSIVNYFMRLYYVKKLVKNGINERIAIKDLSPPIFIMNVNIFLQHVRNFELQEMEIILGELLHLESLSKKRGMPIRQISERLILIITGARKKELVF